MRSQSSSSSLVLVTMFMHMPVRTVFFVIVVDPAFVLVHENGYAIAENCKHGANGNRDCTHRPHVHPQRHPERRSGGCCKCSSKSRNDPDCQQERRRTYGK